MKESEYLQLLQRPYDWNLTEEEKKIAVRLAKEFGGKRVLHAWHEFQEVSPLDDFQKFEPWFRERIAMASAGEDQAAGPFDKIYERVGRPYGRVTRH